MFVLAADLIEAYALYSPSTVDTEGAVFLPRAERLTLNRVPSEDSGAGSGAVVADLDSSGPWYCFICTRDS